MGECPEWYPLLEAAIHMKVKPWELEKQPQFWIDVALMHKQGLSYIKGKS
jgi:hypothetical protein